MPLAVSIIVGLPCTFLLGFAIQRGNTCTVAALHDLLRKREAATALGIVEAMIAIAGLYCLLHLTGLLTVSVPDGRIALSTLLGGLALGFGAVINGSCTIGSIARIGSGNPAYLLTPLGILIGVVCGDHLLHIATTPPIHPSPLHRAALPVVLVALSYGTWRLLTYLRRSGWHLPSVPRRAPWPPRRATAAIALLYVTLTVVVGPWAYSDIFVEATRGSLHRPVLISALVVSLVIGTLIAGRRQMTFAWTRPTPLAATRCVCGGALIGIGILLVPGAHDTLTLVETPLGVPVAACALAINVAVIAVVLLAADKFRMKVCACETEVMNHQAVAAAPTSHEVGH